MKAIFLSLLLVAAPACEAPAPPAAGPSFPALSGRVVDEADLLDPGREAELARLSEAVERESGPQYVIVTLRTLQGYRIEDYGVQLGRHWGIGSKARNDGLLLIVAPNERKARIEVGYGLERRVTDPFAARVLREHILPRFQAGDFAGGIGAGSAALVARLRSRASDAEIAREDGLVS